MPPESVARPNGGWIRTIRTALGMTQADLARRLDITKAAVAAIESSERRSTIRLETLERAAAQLDCELVYALVPRESLQGTVRRQAQSVASRHAARVNTTMALEEQSLTGAFADDAWLELVSDIEHGRGLWSERIDE